MLSFNFIVSWNIFFATMVIFSSNPIYAVISLIVVILGSSFILFLLEVEFLAFILLLIYIGAISVLFLFVVMLLQVNINNIYKETVLTIDTILYAIMFIKSLWFLYFLNKKTCISMNLISYEYLPNVSGQFNFTTSLTALAGDSNVFLNLFSHKSYFFVVVGMLLLFSMVGAIVLCVKEKI